jgi:hypothetical protein
MKMAISNSNGQEVWADEIKAEPVFYHPEHPHIVPHLDYIWTPAVIIGHEKAFLLASPYAFKIERRKDCQEKDYLVCEDDSLGIFVFGKVKNSLLI